VTQKDETIAVIGLGYVGLPLAILFSRYYTVIGYDQSKKRVAELNQFQDITNEVAPGALREVLELVGESNGKNGLTITDSSALIANCDVYIVAVPTPVDDKLLPDLSLLRQASHLIASVLKKGDLVIYESTVYPGCTEEEMIPILQQVAGLKVNEDFGVGYSPERVSPGDRSKQVENIVKVTSGSDLFFAQRVDGLYRSVIKAGTYLAPSIKIAEAAKVIENTQRDVNIAFMNELSKIFSALDIDLMEVLKAAQTKWNFLPFHPGLVGGHCIGVDPYYLIHKSRQVGYDPELIRSARNLNDGMSAYVANRMVSLMERKGIQIQGGSVLIVGASFKENTSDIRNSRVFDLMHHLSVYQLKVELYDPLVDRDEVRNLYGKACYSSQDQLQGYDGIIYAVPHLVFKGFDFARFLKTPSVLYDLHGFVTDSAVDETL
jgi:UDP-N-acetyl-D-galactosamine dehydrogenase